MSIPTTEDFGFVEGGPNQIDIERAWRNFGGDSRGEFVGKLVENSEYYSELLMFIEDRAFSFYFEAVVDYICGPESAGDCNFVNGLVGVVFFRLDCGDDLTSSRVAIQTFCDHILGNYDKFELSPDTYGDIRPRLRDLKSLIERYHFEG